MLTLLLRLAAVCAVLYIAVGIGFLLVETRLLYHPDPTPIDDCSFPEGVEVIRIDGERALLTYTGSDALVVFYHGNGSRACNWRFLGVNHLSKLGYDVLVPEFPGYAGDPRTPSSDSILATAEIMRDWAAERYSRVIVFGNSIGTGPASYHAGTGDSEQLILFAPFNSMYALLREKGFWYPRALLHNDYDNGAALIASTTPTIIVHGEDDTLIPVHHGRGLGDHLRAQGTPVTFIPRAGTGHNGLFAQPWFDDFLAGHMEDLRR